MRAEEGLSCRADYVLKKIISRGILTLASGHIMETVCCCILDSETPSNAHSSARDKHQGATMLWLNCSACRGCTTTSLAALHHASANVAAPVSPREKQSRSSAHFVEKAAR